MARLLRVGKEVGEKMSKKKKKKYGSEKDRQGAAHRRRSIKATDILLLTAISKQGVEGRNAKRQEV